MRILVFLRAFKIVKESTGIFSCLVNGIRNVKFNDALKKDYAVCN